MGGVDDGQDGLDADADSRDELMKSDEERDAEEAARDQRGNAIDSTDYYATGRAGVAIGPDGMPLMGGEQPSQPEPGLTYENLVCTEGPDRPACGNYVAIIVPAPGVARGFGELRQIRRFCTRLATAAELWAITGNIYACSARTPQDVISIRKLNEFEKKQREMERETSQKKDSVDL